MKIFLFVSVLATMMLGIVLSAYSLDYTTDLSLAVDERYNDNIFLERSNPTSDFITLINPAISLSTKTEKLNVSLNYTPVFNFYAKNGDNNSISQLASIVGYYKLAERLKVGLSDSFIQSRESSSIRTIEGAGPIVRGQEKITSNTLGGDLSYGVTGKITLLGKASYTKTVSQTGTEDVITDSYGLGASYLFTDRTTFRINAAYDFFDYRSSGRATSDSYTAGVNYRLTPTITADAFGGVVVTRIKEPQSTNSGFTGGASVTKAFERGNAILSYLQNIISGLESTTPIRSQSFTLRYNAPVTTSVEASVWVFYNIYKSVGNNEFGTDRTDIGGNAEFSYRLLPWLNALMSYSYVNSSDTLTPTSKYVNNIVMVGMRLSKQAKF